MEWSAVLGPVPRVAAITAGFYLVLFVMLRVAGRRTLAQLSAFDVVITIALGSLLSATALGPPGQFVPGVTALVVLMSFQIVIATVRRRFPAARRVFDFPAEVIGREGRLDLPSGTLRAQITEDEVKSRLRSRGVFDLSAAALVVLEPDGGISVLTRKPDEGEDSDSLAPS